MNKKVIKAPVLSTCFSDKEDVRSRFINILSDKYKINIGIVCVVTVMTFTIGMFISLKNEKAYANSDNVNLNKVYSSDVYSGDEEKDDEINELPGNNSNMEYNSVSNAEIGCPLELNELTVTAPFGKRAHPILETIIEHNGVDIKADKGDKVLAVADGVVTEAKYDASKGNYVEIAHDNIISRYCHLSKMLVEVGDKIEKSNEIGLVGSTGISTGPHLHLEILDKSSNEYVDPIELIK